MKRDSPVVTVTEEERKNLSDRKIGARVLAALAHTPATREPFSYHAIAVATDGSVALTPKTVLDEQYTFILSYKIRIADERREKVGKKVRDSLEDTDDQYIIVGRS
jgi:lipocalin